MLNSLFDDGVFEENLRVGEENVEDAVTDLHGGTQHDRDVLHRHLVLLLLQKHKADTSGCDSLARRPLSTNV